MALTTVLGMLAWWLAAAGALSCLASLAYPAFRRQLNGGAPAGRALTAFAYALMPPAVACLTVVLLLHPALAAALIPSHCHQDHCGLHRPAFELVHPVGAALAAGSLVVVAVLILLAQRTLRRARGLLAMLQRLARPSGALDYAVVESPDPIAWCAGLAVPRVYLSSGLEAALSDEELQIVLAHEHAHARRRDNLRSLLLRWATVAWQRDSRRLLLADFEHGTEQACDAVAAAHIGSADAVMDLLRRLPDTAAPAPARGRMPFEAVGLPQRIAELARDPNTLRPLSAAWLFIAGAWLAAPAALAGPGHYLIEWLTAL